MNQTKINQSNKNTYPIEKIITILLFAVVGAQILFILYMNLFQTSAALDSDSAMLYTHAIEMWKNKTLFLPNWSDTTTLELDSALLFALPIYGITKQVYLSFGISNVIFLAIYLYVFVDLMRKVKLSWKQIAIVLAMFLMPYAFGMLDYFNMMFINGAQYGIKVIVPLMLLGLMFTPEKEQYHKKNIVLYAGYVFLLFINTFSSGLYVVLCGLIPILGIALLDFLMDGGNATYHKYRKYHGVLFAVSILISGIGYVLNIVTGINARGNNMFLTQADNFILNLQTCVKGLFQLFGAFPKEGVDTISFEGVTFLLKSALVIFIFTVFLMHCKGIFKVSSTMDIRKYLVMLFLVDVIVLVFCDSRYNVANITMEYRYYMIGVIPLMILIGIQLSDWEREWNKLFTSVIYSVFAVGLVAVTIQSMINTMGLLGEHAYVHEVCDYLETTGAHTVTYVLDEETEKCSRLIDEANGGEERKYAIYDPESQKVTTFDYYEDVFDRSYYDDNNLIVVIQGTNLADVFPGYIANSYTYVGTTRWFDVYQSPVCRMDYRSGYPLKERALSIDYAYSPDYQANGTITEQGTLSAVGDGNDTLASSYFAPYEGTLDVIATYAVADTTAGKVGTIEIRDSEENVIAQTDIMADANSVTVPSVAIENRSLKVAIRFNEGVTCEIGQIEFHAVEE